MKAPGDNKSYLIWDLPGLENPQAIMKKCFVRMDGKESNDFTDDDLNEFFKNTKGLLFDNDMTPIQKLNAIKELPYEFVDDLYLGNSFNGPNIWDDRNGFMRKLSMQTGHATQRKNQSAQVKEDFCATETADKMFLLSELGDVENLKQTLQRQGGILYADHCRFKEMTYKEELWYKYNTMYVGEVPFLIDDPFSGEVGKKRMKFFTLAHVFSLIKQSMYIGVLLQNISFGILPSNWVNRKEDVTIISNIIENEEQFEFSDPFEYATMDKKLFIVPPLTETRQILFDSNHLRTICVNTNTQVAEAFQKEYETFKEFMKNTVRGTKPLDVYREIQNHLEKEKKFFPCLEGNDIDLVNGVLAKSKKAEEWNNIFPLNNYFSEDHYCISIVIGRATPIQRYATEIQIQEQQDMFMNILYNTIGVSNACSYNQEAYGNEDDEDDVDD